ncbi:MAG: RelA/SpoT domain-containing protein [Acidimicrobiia bacterium]|nr:RelA/SpoT domain-containing protein [Acidimicrobiia bacterium]
MRDLLPYSNNRIDNAGKILRRSLAGEQPAPSTDEVVEARLIVERFRSVHVASMQAARRGLASCVRDAGLDAEISQRLKRMPTIGDKLTRVQRRLSTLVDLGGCRAILTNQEDVYRVRDCFVQNSLRRNGQEDTVIDYVTLPRESGYRAVHIHTKFYGRRIEVQLRTSWQQLWAKYVEDLTGWSGIDFKNGEGPEGVLLSLRHLSEGLTQLEEGGFTDAALVEEISHLLRAAASAIVQVVSDL